VKTSLLRGLPLSLLVALMSAVAGANPILTVDPGSYVLDSGLRRLHLHMNDGFA